MTTAGDTRPSLPQCARVRPRVTRSQWPAQCPVIGSEWRPGSGRLGAPRRSRKGIDVSIREHRREADEEDSWVSEYRWIGEGRSRATRAGCARSIRSGGPLCAGQPALLLVRAGDMRWRGRRWKTREPVVVSSGAWRSVAGAVGWSLVLRSAPSRPALVQVLVQAVAWRPPWMKGWRLPPSPGRIPQRGPWQKPSKYGSRGSLDHESGHRGHLGLRRLGVPRLRRPRSCRGRG